MQDYTFTLAYHPGNANVVVDALSRKGIALAECLMIQEQKLIEEVISASPRIAATRISIQVALHIDSRLVQRIKEAQKRYPGIVDQGNQGRGEGLSFGEEEGVQMWGRLWVPAADKLRKEVLEEAHCSRYNLHPGSTKTYHTLRREFW